MFVSEKSKYYAWSLLIFQLINFENDRRFVTSAQSPRKAVAFYTFILKA